MTPHFWNTNCTGNTYDVRGKWLNWLGDTGWRSIATQVQGDRTVSELPYQVEFPASAQGDCIINADNRFSMKRHVEERNGSNSEPALDMTVQALAQTNVTGHADPTHPERWLYPGAWPGTTLRYGIWHGRSPRVEKVLEIDPTQVNGALQYQFLVKTGSANEYFTGPKTGARRPLWTGNLRAVPTNTQAEGIFIAKGNSEHRGVTLKAAVAWYFEAGVEVRVPITLRSRETAPGVVEITKLIPASVVLAARQAGSMLFTDATFYPDSNPETNTVDGFMLAVAITYPNWTTLRSTPTTYDSYATYLGPSTTSHTLHWVRTGDGTDKWQRLARTMFLFDTSSLAGSVDAATFSFYELGEKDSTVNPKLNVYSSSPASDTDLVTGDFDTSKYGTTPFSTGINVTAIAEDAYNGFAFNATGNAAVDISGITRLAVCSEEDRDDVQPTWPSTFSMGKTGMTFADKSGTANDPKLEVTTVLATPNRSLLGVGT